MNYNDALNLMISKQSLGIKPGLARINRLLQFMNEPQNKLKIIHIAGTNGKGTVAKTIADALAQNGLKVGLFTSPWVCDYCEQIQINNSYIPKQEFAKYVEEYKDFDATEFEMLTAIMYKYFYDQNVDYAVVECGMGGLGDATNVEVQNVCSVITSVSLDHTAFLGSTIEEITLQKEGIIRNSPCFRYVDTGDFNYDNLILAKKVVSYLGYNDNIFLSKLPARQQIINGVRVDGGHNVSAAEALAPHLNNEIALIGMMRDKNVDGYLSIIAPRCKMIIATTPKNARSMPSSELKNIALKYCSNVKAVDNPYEALELAKENKLSLVCGSFYLARDILKDLQC